VEKDLFICDHLSKCSKQGFCIEYVPFTLEFAKQKGSRFSHRLSWCCHETDSYVTRVPIKIQIKSN